MLVDTPPTASFQLGRMGKVAGYGYRLGRLLRDDIWHHRLGLSRCAKCSRSICQGGPEVGAEDPSYFVGIAISPLAGDR